MFGRSPALLMLIVLLGLGLAFRGWSERDPAPTDSRVTAESGRYVFLVTLHTPAEIDGLLARAETLAPTLPPDDRRAGIALVLHGPEIAIFAKKNYPRYRATVDRAARLDAQRIIEIKMCRTEMQRLGIDEKEIPEFIEVVPYGPDEERRLRDRGYISL